MVAGSASRASALLLLACAAPAAAWVVPLSAPPAPRCPAIPDAADVEFTADELARIDAGEIVVRLADFGEIGRRAWAAGYLDANPVWLFDVGTDSRLAEHLSDVVEDVKVLEQREHGKIMQGVADASVLLPEFVYTLAVSYLEDRTGQCWALIEGDFKTNEGTHSYLWDPARRQTLAVMSFDVSLKGLLGIVPQELIRRLSLRTLPDYMRRLESFAARLEVEDPERAAHVAHRWSALRARLEADELPARTWSASQARTTVAPGDAAAQ
jgi:hypothetical protein